MCGISAIINCRSSDIEARKKIFNLLRSVQHRGQDSYGYSDGNDVEKYMGMVEKIPQKINSNIIIGHTRYRTSGAVDIDVCQPIKIHDITIVHNGNINSLKFDKRETDTFALTNYIHHCVGIKENIIDTIKDVINNIEGSFFVIMIYKDALYCFKDKYGIRPGMYGFDGNSDILICSENQKFPQINIDIEPGQIVEFKNNKITKFDTNSGYLKPCIFEYIYLAHPQSTIYGLKVSDFRLKIAASAAKIISNVGSIDAVCGVPNSSRVYGLEIARILKKDYIEPSVKKKRSFILPTQEEREKYVREKFSFPKFAFNYDHILIVDDSIVRGTTSRELIKRFKEKRCTVSFLSCSPLIVNVNKFGINITSKKELISYNRNLDQICDELGCDNLYYQTIDNLYKCSGFENLELSIFEA